VHLASPATEPEWDLSPTGNEVAYALIEEIQDGRRELRINTPNLEERTLLTLEECPLVPSGESVQGLSNMFFQLSLDERISAFSIDALFFLGILCGVEKLE
jgi:hypothetical protein